MNASLFPYLAGAVAGTAGFWLTYRLFLYNRPQHRLARAFLLSAMGIPLVMPLLRGLLPDRVSNAGLSYTLPEQLIGRLQPPAGAPASWSLYTGYLYLLIAAVLLLRQFIAGIALRKRVQRAPFRRHRGIRIHTETGYGPGSAGTIIFFPGSAIDSGILAHETGHIRFGHRYDLAFANIVCCIGWMNPVLWILRRELRLVHEYEADTYAVTRGSDRGPYAHLLLRQHFGLREMAFSHSFFHKPIKQRVAMLFNAESNPFRRSVRAVAAGCSAALIAACALFVQCRPETVIPASPASVLHRADQMAVFNGDLNAYLTNSLQYPEDARSAGREGRSVVQFVVTSGGTVTDETLLRSSGVKSLDDEALRVVRNMPAWTPATDKGRPVSVYFTLPISFKLDDAVEAPGSASAGTP